MKIPSKRLAVTLVSVFVVLLFTGVMFAMAVAGKINLSGIPVIGDVVEAIASQNTETAETGDAELTEVSDRVYTVAASVTASSSYTSIIDVKVGSDGNIFAADETGMKVYKLKADGSVLKTYNASSKVNAIHVGTKVYVLEGALGGTVTVLNPDTLEKTVSVEVGHTPSEMVVNGNTGYVSNRFSNSISVINLTTNTVTQTIAVDGREPFAMTLAGGKIFAACHLPDENSTSDVLSSNVVVVDTATNKVVKTIDLVNGACSVKDINVSPDGKTIYVSNIISRYAYPTTQTDRGWINTNGVSIIDASTMSVTATVLLDQVELGAANPWAVDVSEDGKTLVVTLAGTDEVMLIDIAAMNAKIDAVKNGTGVVKSVDRIVDYLPFLDGCRTRVPLSGKGARSVDIKDGKAYIGLYFAGTVDIVGLTDHSVSNISFTSQPDADDVRRGEILWNDGSVTYQKWLSCSSCHPQGRSGGLNWDETNDGIGNPKSTKSMMYSHRTPPTMHTGITPTAEEGVEHSFNFVISEEDVSYVNEYLKSLRPEQSPYLNRDGTLTESAQRGKALFESQGCAKCHPAPLYTDMKLRDVGTTDTDTNWENRALDTPTLVEVWRSGPWLHDDRYNNMEDVVRLFAKGLNDSQITDLANFVLSIGDSGESYGAEQIMVTKNGATTISAIVPGGKIESLSVRRQKTDASGSVKVTVTLKKADGTVLGTKTKTVSDVEYNTAKLITLDEGIAIPADTASGATLTVSITDTSGKSLASDLIIKY